MSPVKPPLAQGIEDQLRFETLISDISARFVRLSPEEIGTAIEEAQRAICEGLDIDRCALWQPLPQDPDVYLLTHIYQSDVANRLLPLPGFVLPSRPGIDLYGPSTLPCYMRIDVKDAVPWIHRKLRRGEPVVVERPEDLPREAEADRAFLASVKTKSTVIVPLLAGGRWHGYLSFASLGEQATWPPFLVNRFRLIGEIIANTMERNRADEALRESEERLSLAADSSGAGLWVLDTKERVFWATPQAREIYGFDPDLEITVDALLRVVHERDHGPILDAIREAVEEKKEVFLEYQILRPGGEHRWISARGRPHVGKSGEVDRLMGMSTDITERKRADSDAQALRKQLSHITRVNTMGEMAASLAHELAQPLTAIRSNAQAARILLASGGIDLAELDEILADIVADNQRAGEMIRRHRSMLKKGDFDVRPQDLNDLIREVEALVRNDALLKDVSLSMHLAEGLPRIRGDRIQIQQILLNLMMNAIEAMAIPSIPKRRLEVRTRSGGPGEVLAAFRDTGPGIPEDQLERIFEPFVTSKAEGMGLGLSICRTIIESHGGRLWAESNPGGGATFHLAFPPVGGGA